MGSRGWLHALLRCARLLPAEVPAPARPPLEVLARDARRLGARFHSLVPGTSFCKVEAVRHAYERVLGDCADALEVPHLLGLLPAGTERDLERARVERVLHIWGLVLDDDVA